MSLLEVEHKSNQSSLKVDLLGYDDAFVWKFDSKMIENCLNIPNSEYCKSKEMFSSLFNSKFRLRVYPDGAFSQTKSLFEFGLYLNHLNPALKSCQISWNCQILEIDELASHEWTWTNQFDMDKDEWITEPSFGVIARESVLKLNEFTLICRIKFISVTDIFDKETIVIKFDITKFNLRKEKKEEKEENKNNDNNYRLDKLEENVSLILQNMKDLQNKIDFISKKMKNEINIFDNWLINIVKLDEYLELFKENGFDDMEIITELNEKDLIEFGISKKGHRMKLLKYIKLYNEKNKNKMENIN